LLAVVGNNMRAYRTAYRAGRLTGHQLEEAKTDIGKFEAMSQELTEFGAAAIKWTAGEFAENMGLLRCKASELEALAT